MRGLYSLSLFLVMVLSSYFLDACLIIGRCPTFKEENCDDQCPNGCEQPPPSWIGNTKWIYLPAGNCILFFADTKCAGKQVGNETGSPAHRVKQYKGGKFKSYRPCDW